MTYLLLVPIVVFLLLSGFFSGAETGAYRVNPVRLQLLSNQGHRGSIRLRRLLEDREGILTVTLMGTNLANYLTTIFAAMFLARMAADWTDRELELYTTLILTPIVLTFGEILPKNWFRQQANLLMTRVSLALVVFDWLFRWCGAVPVLKWLTRRMLRWWHGTDDWEPALHPRSRMLSLLKEGVAEGVLSAEQSHLLDGVLSLSNVSVGSVMVPASKAVTLRRNATRDHILPIMRRHTYSRYPVIGTRRNKIVGVIDVYEFLGQSKSKTIDELMTAPCTLRPESSVSAALYDMREARRTFGVVVDRWDNCIGIVTMKDLVEEIVGELAAW